MRFIDALKIAKANEHLIGTTMKGSSIDEIIIMPTNDEEQRMFQTRYVRTMNPQEAIAPFIASDVEVYALFDKRRIRTENLFLVTNLQSLPKELNTILEVSE